MLQSRCLTSSCWKTAAGLGLAILLGAQAQGAEWKSQSAPEHDQLFQRTNGWTGADGNFSVTLTNDLTLWLFSDTFVGEVRNGRRTNATMINNSAAWQRGADPARARVDFFHGSSPDGKPTALITPADGNGWFWLFAGVMSQGKLFLFLVQIERTDDKSVFGFRQTGLWLGEVSNPLAPPPQWIVAQKKIPFAQFGTGEHRSFGSAVMVTNGFVYIYGVHEQNKSGKMMILARVPEADPGHFAAWRFRTQDGWSTNVSEMADLCGGMASEYSVSWLPSLRQWVLICTENGLSDKIVARTAAKPWGPWSEAKVVYRCPETGWYDQIFCYSAKAHPMLSTTPDQLIVTYAANSFEFTKLFDNARLYWPRFVRVKTLR